LHAQNVVTAKDQMIATQRVPKYLVMLARHSLSGNPDSGDFELERAIEAKDLRPVSGAHTCKGGKELLAEIIAQRRNMPLLLSDLQNLKFRVLFVDDLVKLM
jgi:hypothetical protein